jgi:hypothetical protein
LDRRPDDRKALEDLCRKAFQIDGRIIARKPTPEYEDMFGRVTDHQMQQLKKRFKDLSETLVAADRAADPVEACKLLQAVFGKDFPVPEPEDTGRKTKAPAIIVSSTSA